MGGKDGGDNVVTLWRQCVAMVVTVWLCAPCYHIQLTTTVANNNFYASAAFK